MLWNWMRLEIHPLFVFFQASLAAGLVMTNFIWFLEYCRKHKIIRGMDEIVGVKLKKFQYLGIIFKLLVLSLVNL